MIDVSGERANVKKNDRACHYALYDNDDDSLPVDGFERTPRS